MNNSKIHQGQTFLDITLESTGDIENAFAMGIINNISITDDLPIGYVLKNSGITNKRIVALFGSFNKPATALTTPPPVSQTDGIGSMIIETTFIVR